MEVTIITILVIGFLVLIASVWDLQSKITKSNILIIHKLHQMALSQSEDAKVLRDLLAQLQKANVEIQAKIQALIDAAANAPVSDELQAAIDDLKPAAQALDDIVPDAPTPTP